MAEPLPEPVPIVKIETKAQAEMLVADIGGILDRLAAIVSEETRLVRSAKVVAATKLHETKADISRQYVVALETLRANANIVSRFAPVPIDHLRRRHEAFQGELQLNMAVLATARTVSETLIRGVADEMALRSQPKTYGSAGSMSGLARNAARPIAVSRSL